MTLKGSVLTPMHVMKVTPGLKIFVLVCNNYMLDRICERSFL